MTSPGAPSSPTSLQKLAVLEADPPRATTALSIFAEVLGMALLDAFGAYVVALWAVKGRWTLAYALLAFVRREERGEVTG